MLPREKILTHLVAQLAKDVPDKVFIEHVDGESLTYGALHDDALLWAGAHQRAGIEEGDTVLTMLPMCLDFYRSWFGLSWLRAVEVPINTDYRGAMLLHALNNAQPKIAVVDARFLDRFEGVADELETKPKLVVVDSGGDLPDLPFEMTTAEDYVAGATPAEGLPGPDIWDLVSILYTSGTTGPSKGVMMPWPQMHMLASRGVPADLLADDECFYAPIVTYHLGAKTLPYMMALVGGRVVIRERFSVAEFWSDIKSHNCTITGMISVIVGLVSGHDPKPEDADNPLRYVLQAPVMPDVDAFKKRFGVEVCTAYAMTELGAGITSDGWNVNNANHASCGRAREGYELRIVDEHDIELPVGEVGELVVRADEPWTMNVGYFNNPEATATAWRNGWFHTGDAFRKDEEGNYYFLDRIKDAIRRRGENISSFEVEGIVNAHPDVMQSAAVAVPSELAEDEVKIAVVRQPGSELTEQQLCEELIPKMPRFMIPRYIEFVDELPRTPTDRVQKIKLREAGITANTWDREKSDITIAPW
jgi:carnitine-CoA ligase